MSHSNISIFIPHLGCPFNCIFCDQYKITGVDRSVTPADVKKTLKAAANDLHLSKKETQIAFFGGSFTAINRKLMVEYLESAASFLGEGGFDSIRISTRPDCVQDDVLELISHYGVKTIELGIQSFDDDVLRASKRGYDAKTAIDACKRITEHGFELGVQMMCGLPNDTPKKDMLTARITCELGCKQVRIYPVIVIRGTELQRMYERGQYAPISLEDAVSVCSRLYRFFNENGVTILKMGLHSASDSVAGPFHPAFGELVRSRAFLDDIKGKLSGKTHTVYVSPAFISTAIGNGRANVKELERSGIQVVFKQDSTLSLGEYRVE